MNEIVQRLRALEQSLSDDKGPFKLFGLFLREDAPDVWDLVAAADWLDRNSTKDMRTLAEAVRKALGKDLITKISRVIILDADNPALRAVSSALHVSHSVAEVSNSNFFGLPIRHAYIITSRAQDAA